MNIYILAIALYCIALIIISIVVSKYVKTGSDFIMVAGRKFNSGLLLTTLIGGNIGAGQLIGVAWILNVIAGVPKTTGIIIGALVVRVYFAFGGLVSAAYVGILKLAVVLSGFIIAVPFALGHVGGLSGLHTLVAANLGSVAKTNSYVSFFGLGGTIINGSNQAIHIQWSLFQLWRKD